jgi:hypothetical protein
MLCGGSIPADWQRAWDRAILPNACFRTLRHYASIMLVTLTRSFLIIPAFERAVLSEPRRTWSKAAMRMSLSRSNSSMHGAATFSLLVILQSRKIECLPNGLRLFAAAGETLLAAV